MTSSFTIYGTPGESYVQDFRLAFVSVLHVEREGQGLDETSGTPGSRQFKYTPSTYRIDFDPGNPFVQTGPGRPSRYNLEKIYVLYEY